MGGGGDAEQDGILRWRKNEGKIKEDEGLIQGSGGRLLVGHFLDHSLLAISQPQPPRIISRANLWKITQIIHSSKALYITQGRNQGHTKNATPIGQMEKQP